MGVTRPLGGFRVSGCFVADEAVHKHTTGKLQTGEEAGGRWCLNHGPDEQLLVSDNRAMTERHLLVPLVDEADWAAPAGDLLGV